MSTFKISVTKRLLGEGSNSQATGLPCSTRTSVFGLTFLLVVGVAVLFAVPAPAWAEDAPSEVCDGIDNDGDGDTDEDFNVGASCSVTSTDAFGTCLTPGTEECTEDGSDTECVADRGATCVVTSAVVYIEAPEAPETVETVEPLETEMGDPPPEICDGIDNDEDGEIDEGFDVGDPCTILNTNAFGTCENGGTKQCLEDMTGTECVLADGAELEEAEPEALAADDVSCFDNVDNDCDGTADVDGGPIIDINDMDEEVEVLLPPDSECVVTSEVFCNGFDDDNDGTVDEDFPVGVACSAGIGECERTGTEVCDATQLSTICSVSPGSPTPEDTPGAFQCVDGLDNDCDGLVDLVDPDCQALEVCDGVDNDGDLVIDNGFPDLGAACTAGVGACEVGGIKVCNALGDDTQCNVVAALPGVEGPAGATCSDGIDNDCDGLADGDDPSCSSADIAVSCRLVSLKKNWKKNPPGTSCEEKFRLDIESNVAPEFLTAEIMGLNPDGSLIDLSPGPSTLPVKHGDELHLNSRIDPEDWKVNANGRFIDVFAPVPLVRVKVNTGQNRVEAFCSHIPWLTVDQPSGEDQVVSASGGDLVDVVVPIPRVDPATIGIVVDGVEILTLLGIDPTNDFPNPGAPLGGTIDINGQMVTVEGLVVDVASNLDVFGRNALTMTLENLGGGGHIVVVNGDPKDDALPEQTSAQCHLDDVLDAGTVAVFGIIIDEPAAGTEVPAGNTTVSARINHGRDIESAQVQGVAATLGPQTCSPLTFDAFGETFSVDSCTRDVLESLPQTNLSMPLQLGTIDIGQNVLTVGAQDDLLNRTFARQRFTSGLGSTVSPGTLALSPQARAAIEQGLEMELRGAFAGNPEALRPVDIQVDANSVSVNLAFVFGITESGINGFFQSVCTDAKNAVDAAIDKTMSETQFDPVTVSVGGACDPKVTIKPPVLDLVGDLVCSVDTKQDFLTVTVTLPTIDLSVGASVYCKHTKKILGIRVCISKITGSLDLDLSLEDFGFAFNLSEELVLMGGPNPDDPEFIEGGTFSSVANSNVDVGCLAGFFLDVLNIFTLGALDIEDDIETAVEKALTFSVDIAQALRDSDPDPLEVQKLEVNEQIVEADGFEMDQEILQIMITEGGLTGTIGANFTVPLPEDTGIEATIMESPAPEFPIPNSKDLFFAASDDIFNLLFAAIGLQGAFTTSCVDPGLTLGDTLPADCNALATDEMIGRCHGATTGFDCFSLTNSDQGFLCLQTQIALGLANISEDTGLLFCANQPNEILSLLTGTVPPRTLIKDLVPTPDVVEAEIHLNDLAITVALDRNGDGQFDQSLKRCLDFDLDTTTDCRWSDACFDVNLASEFTLGMPTPGSAQIVRTVTGVSGTPVGFECTGPFNLGGGSTLLTEAGSSGPVDIIQDNIEEIVRIFEALGLDLGSLVGFSDPAVLAIDVPSYADPDCLDCAEYVGITGDIVIP